MTSELRSVTKGVVWPALPSQRGAALLSLLFQLEETQWWSAERLLQSQMRQLETLLRHAWDTVPYYRDRLGHAGYAPGQAVTPAAWRALPILSRREVQSAGEALVSRGIPAEYGPMGETHTSGSTGQPVKLRATLLDSMMWAALAFRDYIWHQHDFSGRLAVIRPTTGNTGAPPGGTIQQDWGAPVNTVFRTGPSAILSLNADIATQAQWLTRWQPDYLVTFPTNLKALIEHFSSRGERLRSLRAVRTVSEIVTPALRALCLESWGVPIVDTYSSQEIGYIAAQCPDAAQYHVMAEGVLVEILDEAGAPCAAGETGRHVVTSLHNLATPLIRYELRDHAEAGAPCACGRGLPTIARILGRTRNMLTLPDGRQHWPLTGFMAFREIAPVRQYQFVQHTREEIEVRFVVDRPLTADEEGQLGRVIQAALDHPFRLRFTYFADEIPRNPGGKFEEFVSLVEQGERKA